MPAPLPPRSTPFSPVPGSPGASGRGVSRSSPALDASRAGTPSAGASAATGLGLLGRDEETTYHRRLRSLIDDHLTARRTWERCVSDDAARVVAEISTKARALDDALALSHATAGRQETLSAALDELEDEVADLADVMARVEKTTSRLQMLADNAQALLVDATRAKGPEFTTQDAMWGTWTLEQFVSYLRELSGQYVLQAAYLRILARQLTAEGCAPAQPSAATAAHLRSRRGKASGGGSSDEGSGDEISDESEDDGDSPGTSSTRRRGSARKLRGKLRERVLEEWGSWRYVVESGPQSGKLFEDVCDVEVGRWAEGNAR